MSIEDAIALTEDDTEIDPYTGKLKKVQLQQNSIVQTSLNRNLLYTKSEVNALIASAEGLDANTFVAKAGDTMTGDLSVGDNTGSPSLSIAKADAGGTGTLKFTIDGGSVRARLVQDTSENLTIETITGDHDLKLQTTSFANAVVIDNGLGMVGIGQVPTIHKLQVNGSVSVASGNAFRAGANWLIGNNGSDVQIGSSNVANNFNFLSTTSVNLVSISTGGSMGIGLSAANIASGAKLHVSDTNAVNANLISTDVQVISSQSGAPGLSIVSSTATASNRGVFKGVRSRGSLATPTVPSTDDDVLSVLGAIYDGATAQGTAMVGFLVDGAVSAGTAPQRISFLTSVTDAASRTERMRITSAGGVMINKQSSWTPTAKFSVITSLTTVAHFFNIGASGSGAGAGMIGYSDDGAALASGDRLGFFLLGGSTDTAHTLYNAVGIQGFTTEAWSGTAGGAELRFEVTPNTTAARAVALTLGQDSNATFGGNITMTDAKNIVLGTTTGTKIGTVGGASGQKLGFFNASPIVQPLLATGAGATVDNVITALQNLGLVRQS